MLSQRQLNILHLLISIYIETNQPVGSKTLMNHGIKASSATIRNDLALLENVGYIQKMHSSSGRVPSLKGYRFYVDHLMVPDKLSCNERVKIRQSLGNNFCAIDEIVAKSADLLSQLTSYTTFSIGPEITTRSLTSFRLIILNRYQLIAVIVTNQGSVESKVLPIPANLSAEDLKKMTMIVNERLIDETLLSVYQRLRTEIPLVLQRYFSHPADVMTLFDDIFASAFEDQVYVSGQMNLLSFNMLTDITAFKSVHSLFNNTEELTAMLLPREKTLEIRIGNELDNELLANMSLITASYTIKEHGRGVIALLGPTNMSYARLLGIVEAFQSELSDQLINYYQAIDQPIDE